MRLRALRFLFVSLVVLLAASLSVRAQVKDSLDLSNLNAAQELCRIIGSQFTVPTINYEPVTPPKFWSLNLPATGSISILPSELNNGPKFQL